MNARLMNTTPESLHRQAENCSALCRLFLESSAQYLDLNFRVAKSSISAAREELSFETTPEPAQVAESYAALMKHAINETKVFLEQVNTLSLTSQRRLAVLLEDHWVQGNALVQQVSQEQMATAAKLLANIRESAKAA